jgi:hypothetical protein
VKLIKTANTGNKKSIKTASKIVLPEFETGFVLTTELAFDIVVELEFNTSVELFNIAVEFKFDGIL